MAMGIQAGVLFIGTVREQERKFLKKLLQGAKREGYERIVEPCCGSFALSRLALESGFKPEQIDTSDVSLFSAVLGRHIDGKDCKDLNVKALGFENEDLTDPATIMWVQNVLRNTMTGASYYSGQIIQEMYDRKPEHIERIRKSLDEYKTLLHGIKYRDMDLFEHIAEYYDDEKAIILLAPPTYKAGYEKFFSTGNRLTWNEPKYGIFDPETGRSDLMVNALGGAKSLAICYEETMAGGCAGGPVFIRTGSRLGINTYLTANRPDEVVKIVEEKAGTRKDEQEMRPLKYPIMPDGYEIRFKSKIEVVRIESCNALYYRRLWTHNFSGSTSSGYAHAIVIDGYLAGVFGYDTLLASLMKPAVDGELGVWLSFSMCSPNSRYRMGRLNTMIAKTAVVFKSCLPGITAEKCSLLLTTMITKYPENKQMRGLMELYRKDKAGVRGFKLYYKTRVEEKTITEVLKEWLKKEEQYTKSKD